MHFTTFLAVTGALAGRAVPLAHTVDDTWRSQSAVFDQIFWVFLVLGTVVGIVVIGYMLYNGWKYRASAADGEPEDPPTLGELPSGHGGGKKLFLSFGISAVIVIGLIVWTHTALIYVEQGPTEDLEEELTVEVEGYTFDWDFTYPNGNTTDRLVVPANEVVKLEVTSRDVWHTFGSTSLRIKADAIPGQVSSTWLLVEEEGTYLAECFELCGAGHSHMTADIVVLSQEEYDEWYADLSDPNETAELPAGVEGEA